MKALREEILDHNGDTSMQNSKDEKLSQGEMSDFQSFCRAKQEQAFLEAGIVDTHEVHGKKLLKRKPDKALPCPRCESLDTKFCYFNNYNVNQPRHFCRKCRRYWTAGGVLRNVSMGAGRRRNKHPTTHKNHVDANSIVSSRGSTRSNSETELLHLHKLVFPLDVEPLASVDNLSATSTMLSFGQHTPPCEAMAVLMQQNTIKGSLNEQYASPAYANFELDRNLLQREGNDTCASSNSCLEASSIPASSGIHNMKGTANEEHEVKGDKPGLHTKLWRRFDADKETVAVTSAFYSTTTALHFIDSARENSMAVASDCTDTLRQHFDPPKEKVKPMASDCASQCIDTANSTEVSASTPNWALWNGFPGGMWARPPWPFAPTSVWGPPASDWVSACWHMPWLLAAVSPSSSTIRRPGQAGSEAEGCLLVPKTLRIDDPVEAARSSIWTTLGLDKDPGSLSVKEGSTIAFPYKTDTQDREESKNQSQHLNPAALSRSLTFNETN